MTTTHDTRAARLRKLAETVRSEAAAKRDSGIRNQTPTRRRMNILASMESDARRLDKIAGALLGLAEAWETPDAQAVPWILRHISTRKDVEALVSGYATDLPSSQITRADFQLAAQALDHLAVEIAFESPVERQIKDALRALVGSWPDGYFPTPRSAIEVLVRLADARPGLRWLEPSAGSGDIADVIREQFQPRRLTVCEINYQLSGILKLKGYDQVGSPYTLCRGDFLVDFSGNGGEVFGAHYDRILMNPPFERGQDIEHVQHAFTLLVPGGRLVAIMGAGAFYRSDTKARAFRDWMARVRGVAHPLPPDSFKSSARPTGVATYIVACVKPL